MATGLLTGQPIFRAAPQSACMSGWSAPAMHTIASEAPRVSSASTRVTPGSPSPMSFAGAGARGLMYDGCLFDVIHVIPRTRDLALLLSDQTISVEVWNARRDRAASLTGLTVAGAAGVTVDAPALPHHVAAGRLEAYTVRASQQGDPRITDVVTWAFAGVDPAGTDLTLTGRRLVPLPFVANAEAGIVEAICFLTDVITAHDGSEQRVQLRANARREVEMMVSCLSPAEAQHLGAILYGWQSRVYGVPLWMYAEPLSAPATAGDMALALDTSDLPWASGDTAMIFVDAWTWAAMTVDTVSPTGLTLTSGLGASWPVGTRVVPLLSARLSEKESLSWLSRDAAEAKLRFKEKGSTA